MLISSNGLDSGPRRVDGARLAGAPADRHQCRSGIAHNRLHVGEVEVDHARLDDEIGDTLNTLAQHVICDPERLGKWRLRIDNLQQPLIRNRDQRVDVLFEIRDRLVGDALAPGSLEIEGASDDADSQGSGLPRELGDHR
ncbi:MAG: hypothetical protein R2849_12230 [Thermomicrobiales bacterium]